ncbi:unnamed protein product [Rhizophagus irregularis]|uniref:Uncharacterized protein n=1 Tax=Rhizophagus irregularis TaxID=588596 RepID=A0A916E7K8_9GLOM|nr:unnamed protein product [Rhizophagus irregularis]
MRFLILYFNRETDLMNAVNDLIKTHDLGHGLWIKKMTDYIDETGNLQECIRRTSYQDETSSASGFSMGQQQHNRHFVPSRTRKQWR